MRERRGRRGQATTAKITEILLMLKDGEWHMLDEVREKTQLDENQLDQIMAFLREYEFIILNETKEQLKIQEAVRRFLT